MAKPLPFRLTLASASLGRRELLTRAGYTFAILPSHIDEPNDAGYPDARTLVEHVAWLKAAAVAAKVDDGVVLAADSVGWIDSAPICKPADENDARRILKLLSGRVHQLWTGVCLCASRTTFRSPGKNRATSILPSSTTAVWIPIYRPVSGKAVPAPMPCSNKAILMYKSAPAPEQRDWVAHGIAGAKSASPRPADAERGRGWSVYRRKFAPQNVVGIDRLAAQAGH